MIKYIVLLSVLSLIYCQLNTTFTTNNLVLPADSFTMLNLISQDLTNEIKVDNTDISTLYKVKTVI